MLCVRMTTLKLGNDEHGNVNSSGKIKLLSLLNAVGDDGLEA